MVVWLWGGQDGVVVGCCRLVWWYGEVTRRNRSMMAYVSVMVWCRDGKKWWYFGEMCWVVLRWHGSMVVYVDVVV